tara:strand:- start:17 stop:520 length:504 start_codon:yes stop_codon:yes gene_type:complete
MNYKVVDNFMDISYFYPLQALMFDESTAWYFSPKQLKFDEKARPFFDHTFYLNGVPTSPRYDNLIPTLKFLKVKALSEIRANFVLREEKPYYSAWHCDRDNSFKGSKTAIYYLNNNNGATILKINNKDIKVDSKENRMLIFNSQIKHRQLTQTDTKERMVINYNYYD